jgi:hypothetical protein
LRTLAPEESRHLIEQFVRARVARPPSVPAVCMILICIAFADDSDENVEVKAKPGRKQVLLSPLSLPRSISSSLCPLSPACLLLSPRSISPSTFVCLSVCLSVCLFRAAALVCSGILRAWRAGLMSYILAIRRGGVGLSELIESPEPDRARNPGLASAASVPARGRASGG